MNRQNMNNKKIIILLFLVMMSYLQAEEGNSLSNGTEKIIYENDQQRYGLLRPQQNKSLKKRIQEFENAQKLQEEAIQKRNLPGIGLSAEPAQAQNNVLFADIYNNNVDQLFSENNPLHDITSNKIQLSKSMVQNNNNNLNPIQSANRLPANNNSNLEFSQSNPLNDLLYDPYASVYPEQKNLIVESNPTYVERLNLSDLQLNPEVKLPSLQTELNRNALPNNVKPVSNALVVYDPTQKYQQSLVSNTVASDASSKNYETASDSFTMNPRQKAAKSLNMVDIQPARPVMQKRIESDLILPAVEKNVEASLKKSDFILPLGKNFINNSNQSGPAPDFFNPLDKNNANTNIDPILSRQQESNKRAAWQINNTKKAVNAKISPNNTMILPGTINPGSNNYLSPNATKVVRYAPRVVAYIK